jgi:hypothetical protein
MTRLSTCVLVLAGFFPASPLYAAMEYLRFEGNISIFYDPWLMGYEAALGFTPGQDLIFDFRVDTENGTFLYPYQYHFQADYLAGSVMPSSDSFGQTFSFPEGTTTVLFPGSPSGLQIGSYWQPDEFGDTSIDTWGVGAFVALLNGGHHEANLIGSLWLTHRSTEPPAPVPVPAALWLLVSGLLATFGPILRSQ